eukprot:jgi/Psemu1/48941/gm1.48941_g
MLGSVEGETDKEKCDNSVNFWTVDIRYGGEEVNRSNENSATEKQRKFGDGKQSRASGGCTIAGAAAVADGAGGWCDQYKGAADGSVGVVSTCSRWGEDSQPIAAATCGAGGRELSME